MCYNVGLYRIDIGGLDIRRYCKESGGLAKGLGRCSFDSVESDAKADIIFLSLDEVSRSSCFEYIRVISKRFSPIPVFVVSDIEKLLRGDRLSCHDSLEVMAGISGSFPCIGQCLDMLALISRSGGLDHGGGCISLDDESGDIVDLERSIIRLIALGLSNECMAASLYVSVDIVKRCISRLYRKYCVDNRVQLVVKLIKCGKIKI